MSRSIYYGWLLVVIIIFVSSFIQIIRFGFGLRPFLGFTIGVLALVFLRYSKLKK